MSQPKGKARFELAALFCEITSSPKKPEIGPELALETFAHKMSAVREGKPDNSAPASGEGKA